MYSGKWVKSEEFFNLLEKSEKFTSELGKVTLSASKLESELAILLQKCEDNDEVKKVTLGRLVNRIEKFDILDENVICSLNMVKEQRNYLTHNIYALLNGYLEETILEKKNLIDSDVHTYIERALQLKENLNGLAEVVREYINEFG